MMAWEKANYGRFASQSISYSDCFGRFRERKAHARHVFLSKNDELREKTVELRDIRVAIDIIL